MTVIDLQALYPPYLILPWMQGITDYYMARYNDLFFVDIQPFFHFFMLTEAFVQVPIMIWGIPALLRGKYPPRHIPISLDAKNRTKEAELTN